MGTKNKFDFGSVFTAIIVVSITVLLSVNFYHISKEEKEPNKKGFSWYDMDGDGIEENISHIGFTNP